jgi:geranylgeranyl pyrophosphate synthase
MNELSTLFSASVKNAYTATQLQNDPHIQVYEFILQKLPDCGLPLAAAAAHHFECQGKMIRAKMVMHGAHLMNVDSVAALRWAAAVEVLHNASLIHDDICDGDKIRRGRQSVWVKFGRHVALTLGDWLIALSFELAAEAAQMSSAPKLVTLLARHMATTTAGEALELESNYKFGWDTYLQIAADKTAPLLIAPLQGVALMAQDSGAEVAVVSYFRTLGKAYQVANDIMNFHGNDGAKSIGSDLARRAPNAVILSFRNELATSKRADFDRWYDTRDNAALTSWQLAIARSDAIPQAAKCMLDILKNADAKAGAIPCEIFEVIKPVHDILKRVCLNSVQHIRV